MKIILLGYMGTGKTAVGELLKEKIQLPFFDLDELISKAEEKTIPEIFKTSGEMYFRKVEAKMLSKKLNSKEDFILALGGGTPCYGNNTKMLEESPGVIRIYLKSSINALKERLWDKKEERPLISHLETQDLLEDFIRKHLFERSFYYNQSEIIIACDGKSLEEISKEISNKLP